MVGVDEAQAVGAQQAGARGVTEVGDLPLQPRAFFAHFLEPGGDDHDGLGALVKGGDDGTLDGRRRDRDHAQVDLLAVLFQAGVDLMAEHLAARGVDRDDVALESPLDQVGHDGVADFARRARCPHHRDRLWIEQSVKHGNPSLYSWVLGTVAVANA